ncbi:hypothetical protein JZI27_24615, partial [Brevibacillus sp. AY1]|nr:hypothetical protein [Brevibacillus sp. AY1]
KTDTRFIDVRACTLSMVVQLSSVKKATPRITAMVEKTVYRILAGEHLTFLALQQAKPVLVMKQEDKHKLEQIRAGKAKILFKTCGFQVMQHFQFCPSHFDFGRELLVLLSLLYHRKDTSPVW